MVQVGLSVINDQRNPSAVRVPYPTPFWKPFRGQNKDLVLPRQLLVSCGLTNLPLSGLMLGWPGDQVRGRKSYMSPVTRILDG